MSESEVSSVVISPEMVEQAKAEAHEILRSEVRFYDRQEETLAERLGRCYELAARAVCMGRAPKGSTVVHGSIQGGSEPRIGHAWVVLPDGRVWEPASAKVQHHAMFTMTFSPRAEVEYSKAEANRMMVATGNFGRWHESDYP